MNEQLAVQQIFVYGTLMSSFDNPMAFLLEHNCQLVGQGSFSGKLYDAGDYPVAIYSDDTEAKIQGEIYLIPPEKFKQIIDLLDQYEGFKPNNESASLYLRNIVSVTTDEGQEVPCWVYTYNKDVDNFQKIESGSYIQHLWEKGKKLY